MREGMLHPEKFTLAVDKSWSLRALSVHDRLAPVLYEMHWTIMRARQPHYFITSDNPFIQELPDKHRDRPYGGGFVDKHIEVTMPLSSQKCLLAHWNSGVPGILEAGPQAVKSINRLRAAYADRFLFAHQRDIGIQKLATKYKDEARGFELQGFGPDQYSDVKLERR